MEEAFKNLEKTLNEKKVKKLTEMSNEFGIEILGVHSVISMFNILDIENSIEEFTKENTFDIGSVLISAFVPISELYEKVENMLILGKPIYVIDTNFDSEHVHNKEILKSFSESKIKELNKKFGLEVKVPTAVKLIEREIE